MEDKYILGPDGELYHWGIRGMKWGVRRFQRKDGSLTKAGLKRYANESEKLKAKEKIVKRQERTKAKIDKLNAKKADLEQREEALKNGKSAQTKNTQTAPAKKSFKNMTDEELRDHINRMTLEKTYLDAQKNLAAATPEKVSRGKKFLNGLMNDVVAPAAKNAGRAWLEDTLKDKLGLNKVDPLKKLENEYKKLDWQKKIDKLKNKDDTDDGDATYEERRKKQAYIQDQIKTAEAQAEYERYLRDPDKWREEQRQKQGGN